MKANELLEKQHRVVEKLFEQFEKASGAAEKVEIWEQIAANLVAHDAIEREIFYAACEKEIDEDVLGESLVEHGVVEFCLFRADKHRKTDKLDSYVKVLKEVVEHHVEEEEDELLPKAKRELGDERLEELGAAMSARFDEAMAEDFRKPLRDNLQQVLAGRTTTTPRRSAAKARSGKGRAVTRGRPKVKRAKRTGARSSSKRAKSAGR